jgi:hypothetical protein
MAEEDAQVRAFVEQLPDPNLGPEQREIEKLKKLALDLLMLQVQTHTLLATIVMLPNVVPEGFAPEMKERLKSMDGRLDAIIGHLQKEAASE